MNGPANDTEVRLDAILDWLHAGRITLDQAVARVGRLPLAAPPDKTPHQEVSAAATGEDEVPPAGSAFPIAAAHAEGRIDDQQYAALAEAAAKATDSP